jgi:phospholipid/cholesterol/gamma-HCH transport system substrate-binding protein
MLAKNDVKVGLFVLLGIVLAGLVIFLIGDERRFFDRSVEFKTNFENVQGLKPGAPVRMGGVRVGQVNSVSYSEDIEDPRIQVSLRVVQEAAGRIREDAKVKIDNKGFLGDKMVTILGGKGKGVIKPGGHIPGDEPDDFVARVDKMAGNAERAMKDVSRVAENLANEELHRDLRESMRGLSVMLKQVTEGEGYPNRFLNNPAEADRISRTIDSFDRSAGELAATLSELRVVMRRVRTGPGFAHDVIYGDGPSREIAQFGKAADEVAMTLKGIREGDGFAHDVLFGGDKTGTGDALSNVTEMTGDLRDIVKGLKQGKGTLGALLVDPSVYEDVKKLVGDVERNNVLRALVRYSIKSGDKKPSVNVGSK